MAPKKSGGAPPTPPTPADKEKFYEWNPDDREAKVKAWQLWVSKMDKDTALQLPLREYFTPVQVTWLWARLNRREIPKADGKISAFMQDNKIDKHVTKNRVLMLNLNFPDSWQEHTLEITEKLTMTASRSKDHPLSNDSCDKPTLWAILSEWRFP